jgi:hypothetical protein
MDIILVTVVKTSCCCLCRLPQILLSVGEVELHEYIHYSAPADCLNMPLMLPHSFGTAQASLS